ncbi:amidohydrolase family protein [Methylobacterium fujisawaense]|uniref:hypothetical protein n=1 Tax=Methylobacterium fujisawaense TaxID=107400 RepID=UPI00313F20D5
MIGKAGPAYEIFSARHAFDRSKRTETKEIDAEAVSAAAFVVLQDDVLGEVKRRGLALETLPTSNLRISFYEIIEEHHLFRWLGLADPDLRNRPTVVVGSGDPGIFATSLKNEYAALSSVLRSRHGKSARETIEILESLADAGRVHRFRPVDTEDFAPSGRAGARKP